MNGFLKMNILVVTNDIVLPNKGGGAPRSIAVAKAFSKSNSTFLLAPTSVSEKEASNLLKLNVIKMHYVDRNDKKKIIKYGLYNPFLFIKIFSLVKRHKIDLIFSHNSICGFPALIAAKLVGKKTVFDITDFVSEFIDNTLKKSFHPLKIIKWIEGYTIKNSTITMTNTETIKKHLESKYKRSIEMVYDGFDSNIFYPKKVKKDKSFIIINQGGMDPQDGLEILIPAVKLLVKRIPELKVYLIGHGKVVPGLKQEIRLNNLEKYFFFSGWVSQNEVNDYMNKSDVGIVILPNLFSGKTRVTLRTFEYFACKKPVVAASLSAIKEIIKDNENGILYEPDNPESLAAAVLKVYNDRKFYNKLSGNGYKTSKNFEWSLLADKIVKISLR